MMYLIVFAFGTMFGISLRIKSDYKDAYTMGYRDGVRSSYEQLDQMLEEDDNDE